MRYVEFRPGFAAWSNLQRARDHVGFFEANLEMVANHHQSTNTTILHMALASPGYEATARLLIERGAVFDVFTAAVIDDMVRLSTATDDELGAVDHYGASLLHWAAMYGGAETVSLLLAGALPSTTRTTAMPSSRSAPKSASWRRRSPATPSG